MRRTSPRNSERGRTHEETDSGRKVPVVFYFAMREPGRTYRFHFIIAEPVVRIKEKKAEMALLEQYTVALEQILKRYPEQWFNYYPFWEPAGKQSPDLKEKQKDATE